MIVNWQKKMFSPCSLMLCLKFSIVSMVTLRIQRTEWDPFSLHFSDDNKKNTFDVGDNSGHMLKTLRVNRPLNLVFKTPCCINLIEILTMKCCVVENNVVFVVIVANGTTIHHRQFTFKYLKVFILSLCCVSQSLHFFSENFNCAG